MRHGWALGATSLVTADSGQQSWRKRKAAGFKAAHEGLRILALFRLAMGYHKVFELGNN